jgi:hypothetical protein
MPVGDFASEKNFFEPPGVPAFELTGARSFAIFEWAGLRFMETPEHSAKESE